MNRKIFNRPLLVKVGVSCCFFLMVISFVQVDRLVEIFSHINWFYFILSFLMVPILLVVSCLKWKMVLDLHENKIPFLRLIKVYLVGFLFSNLLPSTVGGDVVRSYYSGKIIKDQSFSAIAIFIERFSGVFMLLLLVILAPILKVDLYQSPYIFVPAVCAFLLILVILWIWKVHKSLQILNKFAHLMFSFLYRLSSFRGLSGLVSVIQVVERKYSNIHKRLQKLHDELGAAVSTIRKDKALFLRIILITVLFYLLTWVNVYVTFLAFGVEPPILGICAIVPTILFVAQIPVTLLGNLGFFESVFVFYFLLIGIPGAETLAMGLLLRLKMITIGAIGYFVYLSYDHDRYICDEDNDRFHRHT